MHRIWFIIEIVFTKLLGNKVIMEVKKTMPSELTTLLFLPVLSSMSWKLCLSCLPHEF
jgi:hypothetical protein